MMNDAFLKSVLTFSRPLGIFVLVIFFWGSSIKDGYVFDGGDYILGRDFLNMWHYGISAFLDDPGRYYNDALYNQRLDNLIAGHDYKDQQFSYPPHFMLLAAPFGLMPYNLALFAFMTVSLALFLRFALTDFDKPSRNILIWAPAFALALICGQLSFLLVVIFATILKTMDEKPLIAGALIALLTIKPQIGFLFPIFLLATRRYKVFSYASLCTIILIAISITIHGLEVWTIYFTSAAGSQAGTMIYSQPLILGFMPTLYVNLGIAGLSPNIALTLHGLAALITIVAMAVTVRRIKDTKVTYVVFIATSFVATPYLMVYDTLLLVWAAMLFASVFIFGRIDKAALFLLLALPIISISMAFLGFTGYTIPLWLFLLCIQKHAWKSPILGKSTTP